MAIYRAIIHGRSPQLIVSDHANHVEGLTRIENRSSGTDKTFPLHPMNPNLDIWRRIKSVVGNRGGLMETGDRMLWIIWQRAHLRATTDETSEQKYLRRGNDAANHFANEGRKLHESVERARTRTDYLFEVRACVYINTCYTYIYAYNMYV